MGPYFLLVICYSTGLPGSLYAVPAALFTPFFSEVIALVCEWLMERFWKITTQNVLQPHLP